MSQSLLGYGFSLLAALCYGAGQVLTRKGVSEFTHPLVGATIALLVGLLALAVLSIRDLQLDFVNHRRAMGLLALSGLAASIGVTSLYFALTVAPVVVIAPLTSTSPLVSLFLAHLFLQRLEGVTKRIILGSLFIVAGVALVGVGRA